MKRYDDPYNGGYPKGPQWGQPQPLDPNWSDGTYHGSRMGWDHRQAGYGYHRQMRERDLQGYGGFDGIYDEGPGAYNRWGQFEHPYFRGRMRNPRSQMGRHRYDVEMRHGDDGGVRGDTRHLRQYNANSPMLRGGGYDRNYGWAPSGPREGELTSPQLRGRGTDERRYSGYNRGGFAPSDGSPGLDPRRG